MNIILSLLDLIYAIITAIINTHYYILKKIRKNYLDKYYKDHIVKNLFSLIFKIIILSIYEFFVFHIHIFLYLIHHVNIGTFGIFLRFALTISISCIIAYISEEIIHIFHFLFQLILSILHLFTIIISFIFYIFTFNKEMYDIILFKKQFSGLKELSYVYLLIFTQIYRFLLIIPHFTNLFSIIRIIELFKNKNISNSTSLLSKSFIYIFFDILILTPGYIFLLILPPVFITTNINIYKNINKKEKKEEYPFPNYNYIKNKILNDIIKVIIYILVIILTLLTIPFIWKIHKFIYNLVELFKTNDYHKFFDNYFNEFKLSFLEIINFIKLIIIFPLVIILTLLAIPFIWKIHKFIYNLVELFKTNDYQKFFVNYYDYFTSSFIDVFYFIQIIGSFIISIILTIVAILFIWKLNKFIENLIEFFRTQKFQKFCENYYNIFISCLMDIYNLCKKIILSFFAIILTIITIIPFVWKIHLFIQNLIGLFRTNDFQLFLYNYYNSLLECFVDIINFVIKIILLSISIILTTIAIPFVWKYKKFIANFINLFKTKDFVQFLYIYFDNLLEAIKQVIIYTIAIILIIIAIPFIWKIHKFIKILIELFKNMDCDKFLINYFSNLSESIIEIILSILIILNHLSPVHLKALYDTYYIRKNKDEIKNGYSYHNLYIFIEKWLDIFVFIFSIFRILTINFYLYIIFKKCNINFFFLLLNNEAILNNESNYKNRFKIIKLLFLDILTSFLLLIQFILGILNPFFSVKIIKDIYLYFITCKNQTKLEFKNIENKFKSKSITTIFNLLFFIFIYLPLSLVLNILAIWTIKYNINLLISINKRAIIKLKNSSKNSIEYTNKRIYKTKFSKYCFNLGLITKSLLFGYILIFKMIMIHLNIFRIFIFWYNFKKNKKINFINLVSNQYRLSIIELIFVPFLLIIIILEPWNYDLLHKFLSTENCDSKCSIFGELIIRFFKDFKYIFIFILLMITLLGTIPTIILIIRSIKRKFFPKEENKLVYAVNYKTEDFRTELLQIYNKSIKKFITAFLFILNILLLSRIIPLFRRTWPFFKIFLKKCGDNLNKFLLCKKKKNIKNDRLTEMPYIIVSEICKFLDVKDINNLSISNSKINEKANINYIWENIFFKKYDKLLKEQLETKEYNKFSYTKFETFKECCKNSCLILLSKQGKEIEKAKTFHEIVEEEIIKSIINLIYLILLPIKAPFYIFKFVNILLNVIYNFLVKYKFKIDKEYLEVFYKKDKYNLISSNIRGIILIIFQIFMICFALLQNINLFIIYTFKILNLIIFKVYNLLVNKFLLKRIYEKTLIIHNYNNIIDSPILVNIKGISIFVFQIIVIIYCIFLIPQLILRLFLEKLNLFAYWIYEHISNILAIEIIYEKALITNIYLDKTDNPIVSNVNGLLIIIFQIIIIIYSIFLIPQIILRCILKYFNKILFYVYEFLNNKFSLKNIYEKTLITKIYENTKDNLIIVNIKGIFIILFQIIIISYCIFLIPQIILSYIFNYLNIIILFNIYEFLVVNLEIKKIYEKNLIINIYENKEENPILLNIKGIFIIIFQIFIIIYYLFLIPQILLKFILKNANLTLYKVNEFLIDKFTNEKIYEKALITNIYEDKYDNPIIVNIKGIFLVIFQIIIICYSIFLITQVFLRFILKILNIILFKIYDFLANTFIIRKYYEQTLISNIYDKKEENIIIVNIKGLFIIIFQIIIISYYLFLIPQIILRYLLEYLNLTQFNIYDFLVKIFKTKQFYEKTLINNNYGDKALNPIIVNIKGIFIIIYQIIIINYTLLLIPQIFLIKCLVFNFSTKSEDISLEQRVQNYSLIMIIIQLIYGFIYYIIVHIIYISPSLYFIFIDLDLKSKNSFDEIIKDLSNIIYYSNLSQFTQIFFGKYYINIIFYYINKLMINHVIIHLSKTTDIIFVKILENIFNEFYKISFISIYFPIKYSLKYIGISFKCISIRIKNISKYLDLIFNVISLIISLIPFYLIYLCFENDSKKILFIEVPMFIYLVFNMWRVGRTIKDIEDQYGSF